MTWLFGNYGRLSRDEKGEKADSKETQLNFNAGFVRDNNLGIIVDNYFDDDISGVIFEREDLDRLKEDIEMAKINAIVVKDLSRLGRSNAKTLTLLEYFEERNVRLVAINDHYDSLKDSDDLIGIKTWYNERYIKDISVKIRSNVHQKLREGEYLGTAPYGYRKEYRGTNNKLKPINKLVIDENIRPVITEIFDLYIAGYGYKNIAGIMEERGYPNPSRYKGYNRVQSERWTGDHIRRIIKNRVYCGDTVQGISERVSYKSKKTRKRPVHQWYIRENTHEPIVARETWLLAKGINEKRAGHNGSGKKKSIYLFSGFLQCGACGKFLCARKVKDKPLGYICSTYFHLGRRKGVNSRGCASHYVRDEVLHNLVLRDILAQISPTVIESAVKTYREKKIAEQDYSRTVADLQREIKKYQQQLSVVYEDRLNEVISVTFYQNKEREISQKIDYLKLRLSYLEKEKLQKQKLFQNGRRMQRIFDEFAASRPLTRELLERTVKKIYIFLPGDINEANKRDVRLRLNTDADTVERLSSDGGIFIEYNFKFTRSRSDNDLVDNDF